MNHTIKISLVTLFSTALIFLLANCEDNPGDDPQPTSLAFNLTGATFNGTAIDPLPDFALTINFDADGNPDGYTASGSAPLQPTLGTSGTWSASSGMVTFSSGDNSRVVAASNALAPQTTAITFTWSLTKINDGVEAREQGEYVYSLSVD